MCAAPSVDHAISPHPFFVAARAMPLIVQDGEVFRVTQTAGRVRPYLLFGGGRFALEDDQSLREYDEAYFEDNGDLFGEMIQRRAAAEAAGRLARWREEITRHASDVSSFLVNDLIPRLRAFHLGPKAVEDDDLVANERAAELLLKQERLPRTRSSPLCEVLPQNHLVHGPYAYELRRQRRRLWGTAPDPGVYFPTATFKVGPALPLSQIQESYDRLLRHRIETEATRRTPRYAGVLLRRQQHARQARIYQQICDLSRFEGSEILFYDDPYHSVGACRGVFRLYRHVPAFILRDAATNTY